jgi:hypothetical protein
MTEEQLKKLEEEIALDLEAPSLNDTLALIEALREAREKVGQLEMHLDRARSMGSALADAIREDFRDHRNAAYSVLVHNEDSHPWLKEE